MVNNGSETLICPYCGTNDGEVRKSGFLGCEHCYELFLPIFEGKILNLRRGVKHCGKRPNVATLTALDEYNRLNAELKSAIRVNDRNRVAAIQAQIRSLRYEQRDERL